VRIINVGKLLTQESVQPPAHSTLANRYFPERVPSPAPTPGTGRAVGDPLAPIPSAQVSPVNSAMPFDRYDGAGVICIAMEKKETRPLVSSRRHNHISLIRPRAPFPHPNLMKFRLGQKCEPARSRGQGDEGRYARETPARSIKANKWRPRWRSLMAAG